ncbi:MAG: hypothetical protein II305_06035 [Clostridia bacterium]|nr:hypothetical protein [Clostridia bacterium]MBQ5716200.1 hypothetical protein [Clostridia bacterium]
MNNFNQSVIEENDVATQIKSDSCFKIILFNIIGFVAGIIATTILFYILKFLLINIIGQIPIVTKFLSWPCDYEYYALCTIIIFSVGPGMSTCAYFCNLVEAKYNYGVIVLGIFGALYYLIEMIMFFSVNGFRFIMLVVYLLYIGTYLIGLSEYKK